MTLRSGDRLGPYEIVASLGAGGMGEVYRARDPRLEREVAIKVLPEEFAADHARLRRFEQEARSASALNHPHIVTIYDIAQAGATTYLVMELVDGQTLRQILLKGPLPGDGLLDLGSQIADGLAKAHESGIVHRDLKPENVMVTKDGLVKILDFGLAKFTAPGGSDSNVATLTHAGTGRGTVLGTVGYMSPEQASGEAADYRADQFSLGAILYEMATGERAFRRPTPVETLSAIIREQPKPIAEIAPAVPQPVRRVVERCLEKDPVRRYGSTRDLARDLRDIRSGGVPVWPTATARRPAPGRRLALAIVVLIAVIAAAYFLRGNAGSTAHTLAVLPFVNATGDEDLEYLSDGITESVINSLSQSQKLRVIALTSVLRYKGHHPDSAVVGRELNVNSIVMGRVVRRPDGLVITAELVNAGDRSRLWGERYDTKGTDVLGIQDSISKRISETLRLRLTGAEQQRLTKRFTQNTEAYQEYLKGRFYAYRDSPEDYEKSLAYYRSAIEKDPSYGLAYAGMARSFLALTWEGWLPPAEGWQKTQAAVARALELDDTLALGHFVMAQLHFGRDWNWKAADVEHRRALELDPQDPILHRFAGFFHRALGHWDEAIARMKEAQELDPLTVETTNALGSTYFWHGSYDLAIEIYRKALELDPKESKTHDFLSDAYARKRDFAKAIAELRQAVELNGDDQSGAALEAEFEKSGYASAMNSLYRKRLALLEDAARQTYVSPISFAVIYAYLNEKDRAFEWLQKAYSERSPWLALLRDPEFDNIRSDPRFVDLYRRVGLP